MRERLREVAAFESASCDRSWVDGPRAVMRSVRAAVHGASPVGVDGISEREWAALVDCAEAAAARRRGALSPVMRRVDAWPMDSPRIGVYAFTTLGLLLDERVGENPREEDLGALARLLFDDFSRSLSYDEHVLLTTLRWTTTDSGVLPSDVSAVKAAVAATALVGLLASHPVRTDLQRLRPLVAEVVRPLPLE